MSPAQFENVTAVCKANVYFGGKVVSHSKKPQPPSPPIRNGCCWL